MFMAVYKIFCMKNFCWQAQIIQELLLLSLYFFMFLYYGRKRGVIGV